jgi:hypothetical protein
MAAASVLCASLGWDFIEPSCLNFSGASNGYVVERQIEMDKSLIINKAFQRSIEDRFNPDSEVGESTMDLTYLSTSTYIVEIQLRRSWICAMEIIENKPFVPKFHQISITPLFSTSESGFNPRRHPSR